MQKLTLICITSKYDFYYAKDHQRRICRLPDHLYRGFAHGPHWQTVPRPPVCGVQKVVNLNCGVDGGGLRVQEGRDATRGRLVGREATQSNDRSSRSE